MDLWMLIQTYICPLWIYSLFDSLFFNMLSLFGLFDSLCLLVCLFCCIWWKKHARNFQEVSKMELISKYRGLAPPWGPFFPYNFLRIMSSCFPKLRFYSSFLFWVTPSKCGNVYFSCTLLGPHLLGVDRSTFLLFVLIYCAYYIL